MTCKKLKVIILLFVILIPISKVKANETEDILNNMSEKLNKINEQLNNLNLLDDKYPIGSIYTTTSNTNPSQTIGGKWEAYAQGRTLVGMGNNGTTNYSEVSSNGGSSKVTLNTSNIPAHTHTYTPSGTVESTFTGISSTTNSSGSHSHNLGVYETEREISSRLGLKTLVWCQNNGILCGFGGRIMILTQIIKNSYSKTAGSHTHTLTPAGNITSTFKGDQTTTSSVGGTQSFSVQNPYITVYFWKRIG